MSVDDSSVCCISTGRRSFQKTSSLPSPVVRHMDVVDDSCSPRHPASIIVMVCMTVLCAVSSAIVLWSSVACRFSAAAAFDSSDYELDCNRKLYRFPVYNTDKNGRTCSDEIEVMSCFGRCDSNEISDWRFPYKRSHHPVCIHGGRELTQFVLRDCDEGVEPGTELYVFPQATSCKCHACKSSEASCEGYRYRDFPFVHTNDI